MEQSSVATTGPQHSGNSSTGRPAAAPAAPTSAGKTCLSPSEIPSRSAKQQYAFTAELRGQIVGAYCQLTRGKRDTGIKALAQQTGWPRRVFYQEARRMRNALCQWAAAGSRAIVATSLNKTAFSGSIDQGYCIEDLARCFGVGPRRVERWMDLGLFGRTRDFGGTGCRRVGQRQVARFIRRHGREYDICRVDQVWFAAIVFGADQSAGLRRA